MVSQLCVDRFLLRNKEQRMEPTVAAVDKQAFVHPHSTITMKRS